MPRGASVVCSVQGLRREIAPQRICFSVGRDLTLKVEGGLGPAGISPVAADLLEFAATVYQIERLVGGRHRTNPPAQFSLRMQLRDPNAWNKQAREAAVAILRILGNAVWDLDLQAGSRTAVPDYVVNKSRRVRQVALFSGGVDSTCGAGQLRADPGSTQLVSFYATHQKNLQQTIAADLGHASPCQWRISWAGAPGRGRSFMYRSMLFLALAAVVAESWEARKIYQFENGILATAIPPAESWMMTKHAHPDLHSAAADLFAALFGGKWTVENPFLALTKRECAETLATSVGSAKASAMLMRTESCWYHWSNRVVGGKKKPAAPCGVCVSCVVRRTAVQEDNYCYDLRRDRIRNDLELGLAFRCYYGWLVRISKSANSDAEFYALLPPAGRRVLDSERGPTLPQLRRMFSKFSAEFMETYGFS